MIETELSKPQESRSPLQDLWPPKWFFSYSDLATLMMTFFIILATMLSLNIPLTVLADKKLQELLTSEKSRLEEISKLTEREKLVYKELQGLELEQVKNIVELETLKDFAEQIRNYIKLQHLEEFIVVKEGEWNVRVTPLAPFLFRKGGTELTPQAKVFLDKIAEFLNAHPSRVKIEGHADNIPIHTPRFPSNWELSVARANSVLRYLLEQHKVPIEKMEAMGYGEYKPASPNDSEEGRAKNRRVVFEIIPVIKEETP